MQFFQLDSQAQHELETRRAARVPIFDPFSEAASKRRIATAALRRALAAAENDLISTPFDLGAVAAFLREAATVYADNPEAAGKDFDHALANPNPSRPLRVLLTMQWDAAEVETCPGV